MGCMYSCCTKSKNKDTTNGVTVQVAPTIALTSHSAIGDKSAVDSGELELTVETSHKHTMSSNSPMAIMNLYNRYVNPTMGQISAEGIEQLCSDLDLNPEDFRVLVLAYSLGAQVMCRFTEDEFVKGCERHGITNVSTMKLAIPNLLNDVKKSFGDFYRWTYKFALDVESGQRTLPTDMALSLWRLVFHQNYPKILDRWLYYLENSTTVKGISKDTWDMFLIFVDQVGEDLESYDDSEAWPSLLDDFVEHELSKPADS